MARSEECAAWTRVRGVYRTPLSLLDADFRRHRFAPHSHEEYTVGVTLGGLDRIDYRRGALLAGPGSVVVLEPGEMHTGGPGGETGYCYLNLYVPPALFAEAAGLAPGGDRPHFPEPVLADPGLHRLLRTAYAEMRSGCDPLAAEVLLVEGLRGLADRHAGPSSGAGAAADAPVLRGARLVADAVRERLADGMAAPPALAELAEGLGLSRYQVVRAFRAATGIPPYAWLAQHRVAAARGLLDAGTGAAEAAVAVGFADQAHMTRWFRRVLGVTPGQYLRSAAR
ncbi:AraC family transcriptional regulator [Mangrovactinospora gilvigrisea]|uniref:AraC family transcriptional regulator n=1 Tax=Mangrovactinospora gilvigrisea TaxID=1428644 RepID=A0A1J7B9N6_9ACTN|nr:AraC family transcriptional regulator [Mangrovactinospora gilvigrisea]OIV35309.1 AraC family transcriptional regulator [Mangrovactinospora gilvigrisea]